MNKASHDGLAAAFFRSTCLAGLRVRRGFTGSVASLFTLYAVDQLGRSGVKVGYKNLFQVCRANKRTRSTTQLQQDCEMFVDGGYMSRERCKRVSSGLAGFTVTAAGRDLLNDFERMLQSVTIKLPGVEPAAGELGS